MEGNSVLHEREGGSLHHRQANSALFPAEAPVLHYEQCLVMHLKLQTFQEGTLQHVFSAYTYL